MNGTCQECVFSEKGSFAISCHRYPPTFVEIEFDKYMEQYCSSSGFPTVMPDEWCGEFKDKGIL